MFEPGTASLALWLAMNPRYLRPRRMVVLARRPVFRDMMLQEFAEPACQVINVMPTQAVLLTALLVFLLIFF